MTHQNSTLPEFSTLAEWLTYLDSLHNKTIDLGLERVNAVFKRTTISYSGTVITVAGTNGKGSTCATLEQLALTLGKTVGVFGSPELLDYKERVRINGEQLPEAEYCRAFAVIEQARDTTPLSPFEFGTLVAMQLIADANPEVVILEVGLGGRLDAVNVVDADLAVITSIGIDHQAFLGDTRELIAIEKAGIMRPRGKVVIGDMDPPESLKEQVNELQANAMWWERDFQFSDSSDNSQDPQHSQYSNWQWQLNNQVCYQQLPIPAVPIQNVATAIACAHHLHWPVSQDLVVKVCNTVALPGRFQVIQTQPRIILDVAHNPQATQYLQTRLQRLIQSENRQGKVHLVVGMLSDKDSVASLVPFTGLDAQWYLATLPTPRSAQAQDIANALPETECFQVFTTIEQALLKAKGHASPDDYIVVFGSFFTVAEVLRREEVSAVI